MPQAEAHSAGSALSLMSPSGTGSGLGGEQHSSHKSILVNKI